MGRWKLSSPKERRGIPTMTEETNQPNIITPVTNQERIASILITSLENFNEFLGISLGLEKESLDDVNSNQQCFRRVNSLVKSINALKQIVRIARPSIIVATNNKEHLEILKAIQLDLDELISKKDLSEVTTSKDDDLIISKETNDGQYATTTFYLSKNFWGMVREVEDLYENVYEVLLRNGLLTPLIKPAERRSKLNAL